MTRRETALCLIAGLVACALVALILWRWHATAARELTTALDRRQAVSRRLGRLTALHRAARVSRQGGYSEANVIELVQTALRDAGLPVGGRIRNLQSRSSPITGTALEQQTVILDLGPLEPGEIGAWLAAWRAQRTPWTVAECQLTHRRGGSGRRRGTEAGNAYDLRLVMTAACWKGE